MTPPNLTPDELYVFSERLGILGCVQGQEPTNEQLNIAWQAVERFREWQKPGFVQNPSTFRNNPMPTK